MSKFSSYSLLAFLFCLQVNLAHGGGNAASVAKKLSNPLADIVAMPLQYNYDDNIGEGDEGSRSILNFQPVIPITLNDEWNVVSRTVLPLIDQNDVPPGESASGVGDTLQSFFFSPSSPTASGWIWGVGPAVSLDTASDDELGSGQWAGGLTALAVQQNDEITYGALVNHLEGFAADSGREELSSSFFQPFFAIHTASAWAYTLSSEMSYDWNENEWSIPVNATVTKVVFLGKLPVSVGGGLRYWLQSSDLGPEGWGLRLQATLVLPKSAL